MHNCYKILITNNKNLNPILTLLINCISVRSVPQIFSVKTKCTFLFPDPLIIGLCDSFANFLLFFLNIFYQKIYKPLKQVHVDIHHILDL